MRFSVEVYTAKLAQSKAFYCTHLGFRVKQEIEGFVVLQHTVDAAYEIMFCVPDSPFVDPIFRPAYAGQGLIFQLEVHDVDVEYSRLGREGVRIVLPIKEEPVNGRHFTITDPNGILIDIVEYK